MSSHKDVLKNTLFLYFRMFITILVSLYATREVLRILGVTDFGIYNVIGGFVAMFSFLTSTMANASTRFFSYELGNDNLIRQRKTFQVTLTIYLLAIGLVLLVGETIGLWFVIYKLNIPPEKHYAALLVYQISLLTLIFNIIRIPYNAAIIAHEKMKFYAYVSIIEAFLKLIIVYCLIIITWNKLILYALLFAGTTFITSTLYYLYATHKFVECVNKVSYNEEMFKEILSFSGWNLTSNLGDVLMDQGLNVLLNIYFGPTINAARGIAYNVKGVVTNFVGNFQTAATPQITKHYAAREIDQMRFLVIQTSKMSFFLMLVIITPLFFCVDILLKLWLSSVPHYTYIFTIIILIETIILSMGGTLNLAIQASGHIRNFVISLTVFKVISFIIAVIGFKYYELPPEFALWVCVFSSFTCMLIKYIFCRKVLDCSLTKLVQLILQREFLVIIVSGIVIYMLMNIIYNPQIILSRVIMAILSLVTVIIASITIGLNNQEQIKLRHFINSKISK